MQDGKYTTTEIQIFVREAKFNNGKQNTNSRYQQQQQDVQEEEDDGYKIVFENLDIKKTD